LRLARDSRNTARGHGILRKGTKVGIDRRDLIVLLIAGIVASVIGLIAMVVLLSHPASSGVGVQTHMKP